MKEGKEADDTTSSQEPCNGPQPLQSKATSEHSQQEASFGGTIPQVRLSFWCTSCPLFYLNLLVHTCMRKGVKQLVLSVYQCVSLSVQ